MRNSETLTKTLILIITFLFLSNSAHAISLWDIKNKIEDIISSINPVERKIRELEALKADLKIKKQNLKNEVKDYMFSHKAATACLVATGSTVIAHLSNDLSLDEDIKNILTLVSVGCVFYMLYNAGEVKEVVETYIKYSNQLSNIENSINEINKQIQRLKYL